MKIHKPLTTYLSTEDQESDWNAVTAHFAELKAAAIIRELIRGKAIDIGRGATKRQAIAEINQDVKELKALMLRIIELLEADHDTTV